MKFDFKELTKKQREQLIETCRIVYPRLLKWELTTDGKICAYENTRDNQPIVSYIPWAEFLFFALVKDVYKGNKYYLTGFNSRIMFGSHPIDILWDHRNIYKHI